MSTDRSEMGVLPLPEEDTAETLLDQLGAKRKAISEIKETNILIPGYSSEPPLLMARYRLLDGKELEIIGQRVAREVNDRWLRTLFAAVDTFVTAIVGFYVDMGDSLPKPLTYKGQPITQFGPDLAEGMQFADEIEDPNNHRQVAMALFANNDVAIAQHSYMLSRWMGNTSIDVNRELLEGNL